MEEKTELSIKLDKIRKKEYSIAMVLIAVLVVTISCMFFVMYVKPYLFILWFIDIVLLLLLFYHHALKTKLLKKF